MSLLSEIGFASLLSYAPRGEDERSGRSRQVRDYLKSGRPALFPRVVEVLRDDPEAAGIRALFAGSPVLVPAPGSAPRRDDTTLWPARLVCESLIAAGLGSGIVCCLRRTVAVPKSAFQPRGQRPTAAEHYRSITADSDSASKPFMVVVDDIVTEGSTLLAAASRLQDAYPTARIAAFALLRTLGFTATLPKIIDPCIGRIFLTDTETNRDP